MDKKVLIVWGKEASFFSVTIQEKLAERELEYAVVAPDIRAVNEKIVAADIILMYVCEENIEKRDFFMALRDKCFEKKKKICLIGDAEYINNVSNILDDNVVIERFYRPIDVKTIVERMCSHLMNLDVKEARKHILVVDDSPITLRTVKSWFEDRYTVSIVSSAATALTFLAKNKPDLILLDYEMPLCNGPQFLEMIKAEEGLDQLPVIFLTSKNDNSSVRDALTLKPDGYLLKTMEVDGIRKYVDDFFKKRES